MKIEFKTFWIVWLGTLIALLLLTWIPAQAADVTFLWDTNDEPDLQGYRLYQTEISGQYEFDPTLAVFDVTLDNPDFDHTGDQCEWTLTGIHDGTWFWVLTAYDNETPVNESGPSNEVTSTIDSTAPGSPSNLVITVIVKVEVNP